MTQPQENAALLRGLRWAAGITAAAIAACTGIYLIFTGD